MVMKLSIEKKYLINKQKLSVGQILGRQNK